MAVPQEDVPLRIAGSTADLSLTLSVESLLVVPQVIDFVLQQIPFKVKVEPVGSGASAMNFFLQCGVDERITTWEVRARISLQILSEYARESRSSRCNLHYKQPYFSYRGLLWDQRGTANLASFQISLQVEILAKVGFANLSLYCFDCDDDPLSNGIVRIRGKNIHICIELVCAYSAVLRSLFYSPTSTGVVVMDDVNYDDFIQLLYVIYPSRYPVTPETVLGLLEMAVRLDIPLVRRDCLMALSLSNAVPFHHKLALADRLQLQDIAEECLRTLSVPFLRELRGSPEWEKLSDDMKRRVGEAAMDMLILNYGFTLPWKDGANQLKEHDY